MPPPLCQRREELRERLLVVCCQRCPVGLASTGGWRDSCSCFESIPSVTEKSVDLKRNSRSHIWRQTDGAASIDTGLELARVAGPVCQAGSMYNLHRKGGPTGECRSPLRCLSKFLSYDKEIDQLLMVL